MSAQRVVLLRRVVRLAVACASIGATSAQAAILRVGPALDPACGHVSIQDAIDAAAAMPGDDEVRITRGTYTQQALDIVGQADALALVGGFSDCSDDTPGAPYTTLDGAGGAEASVVRIRTSRSVRLSHLEITGGEELDTFQDSGGGIRANSPGALVLDHVDIHDNAGYAGGGIHALPIGGTLELTAEEGVAIRSNRSFSAGGGLFAADTVLRMPDVAIERNTSLGCGGGVRLDRSGTVVAPSTIGGIISRNQSSDGGGLCVSNGSEVIVYGTRADRTTRIEGNVATNGGAIVVRSNPSSGARVLVVDAAILDNVAQDGAVATLGGQGGGEAVLCIEARGLGSDACADLPLPADAAGCVDVATCGRIAGNRAEAAAPDVAGASFVSLGGVGARFDATGVDLLANRGAALVASQDGVDQGARSRIAAARIVGNLDNELGLVHLLGGHALTLGGVTVADNAIAGGHTFVSDSALTVTDSIVWQPGTRVRAGGLDAGDRFRHLIVNDASGIEGGHRILVTDPRFSRDAAGVVDYRLAAGSPAIDASDAVDDAGHVRGATVARDADGAPRDIDDPKVPSTDGPRDLGAYERAPLPALLRDGFEAR